MRHEEYRSYDGVGLAALVAAGQVTPEELLDAALDAADARADLNCIVADLQQTARQAIAGVLPAGPLRGVPYALKDLWTQMEGTPTSNGSRLFAGAVGERDSEIVARLRRAGLVIFAKTNTAELGLSPTTEPGLFGPTLNPWAYEYSAGGSSGGAAAAVASGILPAAHATDGGGSIRIPASCCGVFGLKPTRGRITFGPERGEGWGGLSCQHAVSRSVRDSAVLLDATAGSMPGDPYPAPPGPASYLDETTRDPGPLRIGLCLTPPGGEEVDPAGADAARRTAGRCEALGHHVVDWSWPFPEELYATTRSGMIAPWVALAVDRRLGELGREQRTDDLDPSSALITQMGRQTTAVQYATAVQAVHQVSRAIGSAFEDVDVVLSPAMAVEAPRLGRLTGTDRASLEGIQAMAAFTAVANATGQPAMTVPLDRSPAGLPVGSHFLGRFGDEATLFRLAGQLERAHPWFARVPRFE
ncbi:MAG: amidase [Actinomycetota bacterium]|nr:amidase [Actinomycetota bacterium]